MNRPSEFINTTLKSNALGLTKTVFALLAVTRPKIGDPPYEMPCSFRPDRRPDVDDGLCATSREPAGKKPLANRQRLPDLAPPPPPDGRITPPRASAQQRLMFRSREDVLAGRGFLGFVRFDDGRA